MKEFRWLQGQAGRASGRLLSRRLRVAILCAGPIVTLCTHFACPGQDTVYWDGSSGNGWGNHNNWSNDANGSGTPTSLADKIAVFNVTGLNSPQNVNLNANRIPAAIRFESSGVVAIGQGSGGTLRIDGNGIFSDSILVNSSSGNPQHVITAPVELRNSQAWTAENGRLLVSGTIDFAGNNLHIRGDRNTTLAGSIQAPGGGPVGGNLIKGGDGTLNLEAANFHTGVTQLLTNGNVNLRHSDGFGLGTVFIQSSNLEVRFDADNLNVPNPFALDAPTNALVVDGPSRLATISGRVQNTGALVKMGFGTLHLADTTNNYSGGTFVEEGTLSVAGPGSLGTGPVTFNGTGLLVATGSGTFNQTMTFNSPFETTIGTGSNNLVFAGPRLGNGAIKKIDSGTLTLSGASTSTGALIVEGGTLAGSVSSMGGPVSIASGATVVFDENDYAVFNNGITGQGTLIKRGVAELILNSPNTFSMDNTRIETGRITVRAGGLMSDVVVDSGTSLVLVASATFPNQLFSHTISGAGQVVIAGSDVVTLSGNNSYSGGTIVESGSLVGDVSSIRGPVSVASGTTVVFDENDYAVFNSGITGQGTLVKRGAAELILNSPNVFSMDGTHIETGRITVRAGGLMSDIVVDSGASLALVASANFPNQLFSHTISGGGQVVIGGSDVVTLSGNNSYSGGTVVESGSLVGSVSSISGPLSISSGASAVFDENDYAVFDSGIAGQGTLIKRGLGSLRLQATSTHSGVVDMQGGQLVISDSTQLGNSTVEFNSNTELEITDDFSNTLRWNSTSTLDIGSGTVQHTGTREGTGKFVKRGGGVLELLGTSTHSGDFEILAGSVLVHNRSQLSDGRILFNNGTLRMRDDFENELVLQGPGALQTLSIVHSGARSGSGNFIKRGDGVLTLTGPNNHTGDSFVEDGVLRVDSSISDVIVNLGTLDGSGVVEGDVTVNSAGLLEGELTVQGNVTNQGRFAPGNSFGVTVINGDLTLNSGSVLEIEVGGTTAAGVDYDQIQVGGVATLGGEFEFPISFTPQVGDQVTFLTASSVLDTVEGFVSPGLPAGINAQVIYNPTSVQLAFVEPGSIVFVDNRVDPSWHDVASWNLPRIPNSSDEVEIFNQNLDGMSQVLTVDGGLMNENAITNSLAVQDLTDLVTLKITNSRQLFANSGDILVGQNGQIALGDQLGMSGGLVTAADQSVLVQAGGILSGNGSVQSNVVVADGTIQVDSNQVLFIEEQLSLASASTVAIELAGSHGRLDLGVNPSIAGTLEITLADGFTPNLDDVFNIVQVVNAPDMTPVKLDEFEMENLPILPMGLRLRSDYLLGTLALTVESIANLNGDELVDLADINALVAAVASSSNDLLFDLNGDGHVNPQDVASWLQLAGEVNLGPGVSYLAGDSNLDGAVNGEDFLAWNGNKFMTHAVSGWNLADFNADGVTDGADFVIWNMNKFQSSASAMPEPKFPLTMLATVGSLVLVRNLRRARQVHSIVAR